MVGRGEVAMRRFAIVSVALGLCLFAGRSVEAQQCPNQASRSSPTRSTNFSPAASARSPSGFSGGGVVAGQLLTGPGSYFHDLMVQNYVRQQRAHQQMMVAAQKQAKKDTRKQKQLDTRRKQRAEVLARREARKKQALALAVAAKSPKSSTFSRQ